MIALGIDAATKAGWALVEEKAGRLHLLDRGVLDLDRPDAWNPVACLALHCRPPKPAPDVVAIEIPWLGKNVATTITLARICGRFEQAFEPMCPVIVVRASQWQASILGRLGGKTRATLKPAAVLWARGTFGVTLDIDTADAAGIAAYALSQARAKRVGIR